LDHAEDHADSAPSLTIRPCEEPDVPAIAAIYAHHVRFGTASFETDPPTLPEMHRRRAELVGRGQPYLVAEANGAILGYACAGTCRPRAAYRDTVENSIYLRPDQTGRGIGKRLLPALIEACEARDYRQMIAVVGDSGHLASIRLHQHCGFRLVGTLDCVGFKLGRWLDSVFLQRTLGRGNTAPPPERSSTAR
jgi:phosphinothricin acetyltransferase